MRQEGWKKRDGKGELGEGIERGRMGEEVRERRGG